MKTTPNKAENWRERLGILLLGFVDDPTGLQPALEDFIATELQQAEQRAYERGYELGTKMNIPTKKRLQQARNQVLEEAIEVVKEVVPRLYLTTNEPNVITDAIEAIKKLQRR